MSGRVPRLPVVPQRSDVYISGPVRGRTMLDIATTLNWINGRGGALIPGLAPGITRGAISPASAKTYQVRVPTRVEALARLWTLQMHLNSDTITQALIELNSSGVDIARWVGYTERARSGPIRILETVAAPTSGNVDLTVTVSNPGATHTMYVDSISCHEIPRSLLEANSTETGIDLDTLRSGRPIYRGSLYESMDIVAALARAETDADRPCLWAYACDQTQPLTTTSIIDTAVFGGDLGGVLGRKLGRSTTTSTVTVNALVSTSDGTTTGTLTVTAASGGTVAISIPAGTSYAFRTGTLAVDAEDLSTDDGLRGGTDDEISVVWKRTAGSGSLRLVSFSLCEA